MKISPDSWHYRLFCFMSQWNAAWRGKHDYHTYPKIGQFGIGLCPYMRMILIWGPLAIVSNVIPLGAFALAFYVFPHSAAGAAGVIWLLVSLGAGLGAIFLLGFLKDWVDARQEARYESQVSESEEEKPDGFWKLLGQFLKSAKTKVCPVLELEE